MGKISDKTWGTVFTNLREDNEDAEILWIDNGKGVNNLEEIYGFSRVTFN